MRIHVYLIWCMNLHFSKKKWRSKKLFMWNQSINSMYPFEKDMFMMSNHEKHKDYYNNPHLFLWGWTLFKKWFKESFSYETKASKLYIPISIMSWWCPIMKRMEIITMFNSFDGQALILKRTRERKAFLANPKHQYHVFL